MNRPRQLELLPLSSAHDRASLHEYLAADLNQPLELTLTRNRISMVEYRRRPDGTVSLRLHHDFLHAPAAVLHDLRTFLRTHRKASWREVSLYVQTLAPSPDSKPRTRHSAKSQGRVYDLSDIRDRINETYFNGTVSCRIGWGQNRRSGKKRRRSIRYGSCDVATHSIRIHPLLDQHKVPSAFVEYVVFHEMLHLVIPPRRVGDTWRQHPPDFRQAEQAYPDLEQMRKLAHTLLATLD